MKIQAKQPIGNVDNLTTKILFLVDVHLGKLARMLRMLGFDTKYRNDYSNSDLLQIAEEEKRILLYRNSGFNKKDSIQLLLIEDEDPNLQLKKVIEHFDLSSSFQPFTRCIVCNGQLERRDKEKIAQLLEENTSRHFHEFWQCTSCRKIYWKGSHYQRMQKFLNLLESK
ncbi:MAG: hypothetical protein EOO46_13895 [Flavobacterium sp.]|nr:MAG: hypothetical protein EOO46_13895 [Flavobacterium sp.]